MTEDEKKQAAIQAQLDKRAEAIRDEVDAKADAARAADARLTISEKEPVRDDDRRRIDKPEPELRRELPRATHNDHRAPSYSGQGIAHNIDMQRATNPAAYIQEKREALEKKAPELERAAKHLEKPAPRPETDAGKAWQAEKLRNPETATAWHLGAAAVKNDLDNSPNALVREEHKMRLKADPVYKNGYENAQRWEAERKAELADDASNELAEASYSSGVDAFSKERDGMLNEAEAEDHKARLMTDPDYKRGYEEARADELQRAAELGSDYFNLADGRDAFNGGLDNSPNDAERVEHKARLMTDPAYKQGYKEAELRNAGPGGVAVEPSKTPMFDAFVKEAKDLSAADFAKLENEVAKAGTKLPDAAIEQHKERMVNEPDYRDAYSKAAAPLHAERQAEAATAREQKQAEAAPAAEHAQEKEHDNGLTLGVGIGIN